MRGVARWTFAIAIAAGLALAAAPSGAQVESKCLSGKLKGAGGAAAAQVNCEAKAAAKGEAVDPACVAKSQAKLQKSFEKAENKDDCIETADQAAAQAVVDAFVQQLLDTRLGQLQHFGQLADRDRGLGDKQDGLKGCSVLHDAHSDVRSMVPVPRLFTLICASQSSCDTSISPHRASSRSARK